MEQRELGVCESHNRSLLGDHLHRTVGDEVKGSIQAEEESVRVESVPRSLLNMGHGAMCS